MEMIKYIIRYWGRFKEMELIAPFMNGDPLLDDRMLDIFDYTKLHSHAYNVIDTNGINYDNRNLMIHPNLKIVRFTVSAASRETYKKVHGVDQYDSVFKTLRWMEDNKLPETTMQFHFIVTKNNEHEIGDWIELFEGYKRKIFPLHRMEGIQEDSEEALGVSPEWVIDTSTPERWAATRPLFIDPNGRRYRDIIPKDRICQGMSFAVQWDGKIVHCTDAPTTYNYGHVYEVDMLYAWRLRNRARISNPACIACNSKRPDWGEITRKWIRP